jgi:hypothetical protein
VVAGSRVSFMGSSSRPALLPGTVARRYGRTPRAFPQFCNRGSHSEKEKEPQTTAN